MVFSSTIFLFLFLPFTLAGYYLIDRAYKNYFLLTASLVFYAWGEPKFVFIMIFSIIINHFFALLIDKQLDRERLRSAKILLTIMVVFNLSFFFIFKYLNFSIRNLNFLLQGMGQNAFPQTEIPLPIGISFFTFQAMSYVFDVYYRRGRVQTNLMNTALYISLFPQLVAGPIVRYQTVADEIHERKETIADFSRGVKRFTIGLSKKVLLSNILALAADGAFAASSDISFTTGMGWFGAIAYTLQIYFDFSGYSDMAIGLGLMLGFHFSENFDHPYLSKSISEFWRRLHISLGSWFRDYVYIPLGGSRVNGKARLIFNLLIVWLLTGIWHGANWTFILWGLMYFGLLAFEKLSGLPRKLEKNFAGSLCYQAFTLLAIMVGWVLFRSESINEAIGYILSMFGAAPGGLWDGETGWMFEKYAVVLILGIVACFNWNNVYQNLKKRYPCINVFEVPIVIGLATISFSFTVSSTYNPFIYFNF